MRHNDNNRNDIDDDDDDDNVIIFITNEPFTMTKLRTNNVVKVTFFMLIMTKSICTYSGNCEDSH